MCVHTSLSQTRLKSYGRSMVIWSAPHPTLVEPCAGSYLLVLARDPDHRAPLRSCWISSGAAGGALL